MTEPEMDRRMSEIARLMLLGAASAAEVSEYQHLQVSRAKRMVRPVPRHLAPQGGLTR